MVVAKDRERLAVSKKTTHGFHMERFSQKKLKEVENKEQYRVETSKRFTALENFDADVGSLENYYRDYKNFNQSPGNYELKKHKP
jgi:hypothetical protein